MATRPQQEEYLASIAQSFDVGDFDYLPPEDLQSLNALIAEAWEKFKQGEDIEAQIDAIAKVRGR
ncbi:hypothetical protein IQ268_20350 [Oculatella sp. LEGE 06141]|uniref:hypothetical protein n=1 Tax=Oculatella sp. LEGE 06141 TaxID=1828648 RepID=UPI00187F4ACC|nr:hypothetical protein [Oculatella sp. LEGE 06141]MBE9180914.1 hypothetical protein [Oculatella sp. LEGE 06141]